MNYKPYEQLDEHSPNIIVDGSAAPGTVLTLSHWPKSGTPVSLKRDTSTAIVFAYLDSPDMYVDASFASNNHFDEDGLLGIFALSNPLLGMKYRELLLDTSSAGDFGVYKHRDAARIAFAISAYADPKMSPLPASVFALPASETAAQLYFELLNLLPQLLANLSDFRDCWEVEDEKLTASEKLIEQGAITIEENPALDLAIVYLPEDLSASSVHRFTRSEMAECHPFAINSRTPCTRLLTIQGNRVEFQYRYETWVQLASRRPLLRVDLAPLAAELNGEETSGGKWKFDGVNRIAPRLRLEGSVGSSIASSEIRKRIEHFLATAPVAWDPYD